MKKKAEIGFVFFLTLILCMAFGTVSVFADNAAAVVEETQEGAAITDSTAAESQDTSVAESAQDTMSTAASITDAAAEKTEDNDGAAAAGSTADITASDGQASYTVRYEVKSGKEVSAATTGRAAIGSQVTVAASAVDGLVSASSSYTFTLENDGQEFVILYRKSPQIGTAYTTTAEGQGYEVISDESVPLAAGAEVTGYSITAVAENGQETLIGAVASGGIPVWVIALFSGLAVLAAVICIVLFISQRNREKEISSVFTDLEKNNK